MTLTPEFIDRLRAVSSSDDLFALVGTARGPAAELGGRAATDADQSSAMGACLGRCHVCSGALDASDAVVLEDFGGGGTPLITHRGCHELRSGLASAEIHLAVKLGFWLLMRCQHAEFKSWRPALVDAWLGDNGATVGTRVTSGVPGWGTSVRLRSHEDLSLWSRRMFLVDREAPKFEHHGIPLPVWDEDMPWATFKKNVFMPAYESIGERASRGSLRPELEVLARTGGRCALCGDGIIHGDPSRDPHGRLALARDHIHPFSKGGPDVIENLQPLHRPCNGAISSIGPGEIPLAMELGRWVIERLDSCAGSDRPKWVTGLASSYAAYLRRNRRSRKSRAQCDDRE